RWDNASYEHTRGQHDSPRSPSPAGGGHPVRHVWGPRPRDHAAGVRGDGPHPRGDPPKARRPRHRRPGHPRAARRTTRVMKYVVDSSVVFKWVVPEADTDKALLLRDDFRNAVHDLLAPDVFPIEVAHALTRAERQ